MLRNPYAKYQTAKRILADSSSTPEQIDDAVIWLTQAAEAGRDSAQYALGRLYRDGGPVERDTTQAVIWFSHAAEQGNSHAMYALAKLNLEAGSIPAALRWFQKSRETNLHSTLSVSCISWERIFPKTGIPLSAGSHWQRSRAIHPPNIFSIT